ncbi:Cyclic nucleotide-binding domain-containing protein [Durusdinium trenchii]|uniref:Cyclic nucleotide-binding domain-containing protein n=1 Tax=Durusdinium trenchii TaxID=1381693 RepID=A0ABP0PDX4_9DINO
MRWICLLHLRCAPHLSGAGQDVPPLPLVMQHAHDSRPVFPQVPVSGIDDPRFWTYERYQRKKWELNCASACACENMKERQVKMMLFALVLAFLGIVAFGMRSSIADRMVSEAMLALGGVLVFLGCITCCKCLSETHDSEEVDKQLNHPDAAIGKPLMGIELDV